MTGVYRCMVYYLIWVITGRIPVGMLGQTCNGNINLKNVSLTFNPTPTSVKPQTVKIKQCLEHYFSTVNQ